MNNIFTYGHLAWITQRKKDYSLIIKKIDDFYPYFYIPSEEGEYCSIFGKRLKKIVCNSPYDVKIEREKYEETYEADIHYPNRILIDLYAENKIDLDFEEPLRYHFIDIEIITESGLPNPKEARLPINLIGVWDSLTEKYYQFYWKENTIKKTKFSDDTIYYECENEEQMIDSYISFLEENFPDLILGWNSQNFDFPYLFNRYGRKRLIKATPIEELKEVNLSEDKIPGTSLQDYLLMFKNLIKNLDSYSLNYVAEKFLSIKKIDIKSFDDFSQLLEYNKRDIEIMVKLEKKFNIIGYYNVIRKLARSTFDDIFYSSSLIDNLLLYFAKKLNIVLPSKKQKEHKTFKGAYVKQPEQGLFKNIASFDFVSLYPNLIRTFNISPETECKENDNVKKVNINGIYFSQEKQGLFPYVCEEFLELKEEYKKRSYFLEIEKLKYMGIKGIINAVYGYATFVGSRLYSRNVAETITFLGRDLLSFLEKNSGLQCVYIDTDSYFLKLKSNNYEDAKKEIENSENLLNNLVDSYIKKYNIQNHYLSIKFDKFYETIFFGAKKRYFGRVVEDDKKYIDVVGFETKRSDTPEYCKQILQQFYELVCDGNKNEIDNFIKKVKKEIKEIDPSLLGFPVSIKNLEDYKIDPIHIRALKYSLEHKIIDKIDPFISRFKYIFVNKVPKGYSLTDVIAFIDKFPDGFGIDYEKIIYRIIDLKIMPIYNILFKNENTLF